MKCWMMETILHYGRAYRYIALLNPLSWLRAFRPRHREQLHMCLFLICTANVNRHT